MDHSGRNQGEISLLDLIESMKSPDGKQMERPSATLAIALNEEKHRREVFFFLLLFIIIFIESTNVVCY